MRISLHIYTWHYTISQGATQLTRKTCSGPAVPTDITQRSLTFQLEQARIIILAF